MAKVYAGILLIFHSYTCIASPTEGQISIKAKQPLDYEKRYAEFQHKMQQKLQTFPGNAIGLWPDDKCTFNILMSSSGKYGTENVHGKITETAIGDLISRECLNHIINENIAQDSGLAESEQTNHFDNNAICESYNVIKRRLSDLENSKDKRLQLKFFGQILHALQDFYSHSNYVEANLAMDDNLDINNLQLFDFDRFCPSGKEYPPFGRIFTAYYEGEHNLINFGISPQDFSNPESHLYWNKDVSPSVDLKTAMWFSRSSLKRSRKGKGKMYFDFAFSLQVRETKSFYEKVKSRIADFEKSCRLR